MTDGRATAGHGEPAAGPPGGPSRRAAVTAWTLIGSNLLLVGPALWLAVRVYAEHVPPGARHAFLVSEVVVFAVVFAAFLGVGAIIVLRRPRQPIGWLLLGAATTGLVSGAAGMVTVLAVGASPTEPPAWAVAASFVWQAAMPLSFLLAFVLVPLLFPDDRLPSARWRPLAWGAGGLAVVLALVEGIGEVFGARRTHTLSLFDGGETVVVYDVANPLAVSSVDTASTVGNQLGWPLLGLAFVGAAGAAVVRFHRARGVERQQMRWLAFAAAVVALGVVVVSGAAAVADDPPAALGWPVLVGFAGYPIAVGVAALRYRLYEIDRIVRRTVSYGLTLAVVAGVYVAAVVALGAAVAAVTAREGGDLVVASSTLVVVLLFRPASVSVWLPDGRGRP